MAGKNKDFGFRPYAHYDFLIDPKHGGGIRMTADTLKEYLKSEHKNLPLLIDYANRLNNSAAFKRLGFLLEQYAPEELDILDACKKQVTISKTKLDPQLDADKLITRAFMGTRTL